MEGVTNIPQDELETDLEESLKDIEACAEALRLGVTAYSGGDVTFRLKSNVGFVRVITSELKRRHWPDPVATGSG